MPTDLFLQDAPLPSIPDEMVRPLRHILEAAGHSTLWNASARTLVIDSPLEGRVIRCEPLDHQDERTGRFVHMLQRRIDTAGGIVADEGRPRPHVTLWISVEPCEEDNRTRVLLKGRPRDWFSRRAPLGEIVGEKLRTTLRVPVGVTLTCSIRRRELHVYLWAPDEAFPTIATALWLGLMAYFRPGPPVQVPPAPPDFLPAPPSSSGPPGAEPTSGQNPPSPALRPDSIHNSLPDKAHSAALPSEFKPESSEPKSPPPLPSQAELPANAPPESKEPVPEPPPAQQPPTPRTSIQAGSRSATHPERSQGGPITRRIPFDEPLPGTVIWSSGDLLPDRASRRTGSASPSPLAMMPLAGAPAPPTSAPGMLGNLSGQQPLHPGHPPVLPGQPPTLRGQAPLPPGQQPSFPGQAPTLPSQQSTLPAQPSTLSDHQPVPQSQPPTLPSQSLFPNQQPTLSGQQSIPPGQQSISPGQPPILPQQQPIFPGHQPNPEHASAAVHIPQSDTPAPKQPEPPVPRAAASPPPPATPPPPPPKAPQPAPSPPPRAQQPSPTPSPKAPQPPRTSETQKPSGKPNGVQTIQATITSGNGSVLRIPEQMTERRRLLR